MRPHLLAASIAALSLFLAAGARADEPGQDEVSLKNGGTIRGTVVASEPGTSVKIIEMGQKEVRVIPWAQVSDVERGKYAPKTTVQPGPAGPGYGGYGAPLGRPLPLPAAPPPPPPGKYGDPGVVRLHVDSSEPVQVIQQSLLSYGTYGGYGLVMGQLRPVCTSPCDVVVDGSRGQQFALSPLEYPESKSFNFMHRTGDVTLHVSLGSYGRRTGGIVLTVVGGVATLAGIIMVPTAFLLRADDFSGTSSSSTGFENVSIGILAGGVATLGTGIALLTTSSTKITIEDGAPTGRTAQRAPRYWLGEF